MVINGYNDVTYSADYINFWKVMMKTKRQLWKHCDTTWSSGIFYCWWRIFWFRRKVVEIRKGEGESTDYSQTWKNGARHATLQYGNLEAIAQLILQKNIGCRWYSSVFFLWQPTGHCSHAKWEFVIGHRRLRRPTRTNDNRCFFAISFGL